MAVVSRHRRDPFGEYFGATRHCAGGDFGSVRTLGVAAQCVVDHAHPSDARGAVGRAHRCAGVCFAFRLGLARTTHGVDARAVVGLGTARRGAFGIARVGLQCVLGADI